MRWYTDTIPKGTNDWTLIDTGDSLKLAGLRGTIFLGFLRVTRAVRQAEKELDARVPLAATAAVRRGLGGEGMGGELVYRSI